MMWGLIFIYNRVTDGFSVREMTSYLPFNPLWEVPSPSSQLADQLDRIFSQEYRYIGKGCQFYAFKSDDDKYVIKFFKHKHLRPLVWMNKLPIPPFFREYAKEKIEKRQQRIDNLFSSCKLAYEELSYETGVIFLHLNRTPNINRRVVIYDKLGLRHKIDLNRYEFVLQVKADTVEASFTNLMNKGQIELVQSKITQLIDVVVARCEKGIRDRDRSFVPNVAFCHGEERAVFVDIGQFFKDEEIKSEGGLRQEVEKRLNHLHWWTEKHFPELTPFVEQEIARRL